jgi:RNA polymerase sigma-70 factor (ECF subfamily)
VFAKNSDAAPTKIHNCCGEFPAMNLQRRTDWHDQLLSHAGWLRSVVRSRLGEPQSVDDVLQDVMTDAIASEDAEVRMIRPWLYRLAIHKVFMFRRKAGRRRRAYRQVEARDSNTNNDTPLELLLGQEQRHLVGKAMERLGGKETEILVLKYVQGWSYQTISENLDISLSKVTHRLRTSRSKLRNELRRLLDEEEMR